MADSGPGKSKEPLCRDRRARLRARHVIGPFQSRVRRGARGDVEIDHNGGRANGSRKPCASSREAFYAAARTALLRFPG